MEYNFERPQDILIREAQSKPIAYEGKDYPLSLLEHYDFERLIYGLYKNEILNGKFPPYDDIALMTGIRDGGKDCALFHKEEMTGIFQCKHSRNDTPLNISSCAKEIIKFCLYTIIDENLIKQFEDFVYYFASASGFSSEADILLRHAKKSIAQHDAYERWATQVINGHKSLNGLVFGDIRLKLSHILSTITVQPVLPTDIQLLLNEKYNQPIVSRFFGVKLVVDADGLATVLKKTIEQFVDKNLDSATILADFEHASSFLVNYKSHFSSSEKMRIDRQVTTDILDWIITPQPNEKNNIAVLKGRPGSGKSVVLSSLCRELRKRDIPVLAFKADKVSSLSLEDLQKKYGLHHDVSASFNVILQDYEKSVLIIDQLDALSQTLSNRRDYLHTYLLLIEKLKSYPGIKIVVSTREYDLKYDVDIASLNENRIFDTDRMTADEVRTVLNDLKISSPPRHSIVEFLRTPIHLELFCIVYNESRGQHRFESLYDLYNELWNLKVDGRSAKAEITDVLYGIARQIYQEQDLLVSPVKYSHNVISYLHQEGLISGDSYGIQVFHQTFYEYLFAKQFVESGREVLEYIIENEQGILIRSALKLILIHLREYEPLVYKDTLVRLLTDTNIRYHIKELVLNLVGDQPTIKSVERKLVAEALIGTPLEARFFESLNSEEWFDYCVESKLLDRYVYSEDSSEINLAYQMILRHRAVAGTQIVGYLKKLPAEERYNNFIASILRFVFIWDEEALQLFERVKSILSEDFYNYVSILENALPQNVGFVADQLEQIFLARCEAALPIENYRNVSVVDRKSNKLIERLFFHDPDKAYSVVINIVRHLIKLGEYPVNYSYYHSDRVFFGYARRAHLSHTHELLTILIDALKKSSLGDGSLFEKYISEFKESPYLTFQQVLLHGYSANPGRYTNDIDTLFEKYFTVVVGREESHYNYLIRGLLNKSYPFFSVVQKIKVNLLLLGLGDKPTYYLEENGKKRLRTHGGFGLKQYYYIASIPIEAINSDPALKRRYQEHFRRHGQIDPLKNNFRVIAGVVTAPYSDRAYEKMSLQQWEKSFDKFSDQYRGESSSLRGGKRQHASKFEDMVFARPNHFFTLVEKMVEEGKVSRDYIIGGVSGLIRSQFMPKQTSVLFARIIQTDLPLYDRLLLTGKVQYLRELDLVDKDIFQFLCVGALCNITLKQDEEVAQTSEHIRESACIELIFLQKNEFKNEVFSTLDAVLETEWSTRILSAIIQNAAYLLELDRPMAWTLFRKAVEQNEGLLNEHAMWSCQYFSQYYFGEMQSTLEIAIRNPETHEGLSRILSLAWLREEKGAEEQLFRLLKDSSKARAAVIHVSLHPVNIIQNGSICPKCETLFEFSLNDQDEDVAREYASAFLQLDPGHFIQLLPLLDKYSRSKAFIAFPVYFCEFLLKCLGDYPHQCLSLIEEFGNLISHSIAHQGYYDSEPMNVVLGIYNKLGDSLDDKGAKDKCMNIFDAMLRQPHFRSSAHQAIELADY